MHLERYRPPVRLAVWGRAGLSFWVRSQGRARFVARLPFPTLWRVQSIDPRGRRTLARVVADWVATGELPEEARYRW